MATSKDVADLAGVSRATVSAVLNGRAEELRINAATITRVEAAARELGYTMPYHARSLRTGQTRTLGLVTHSLQTPRHSLQLALSREAARLGWLLVRAGPMARAPFVACDDDDYHDLIGGYAELRSKRFDALIIDLDFDHELANAVVELLSSKELPALVIDPPLPLGLPTVTTNYERAFSRVCSQAAARDHHHLVIVEDGNTVRRLSAGAGQNRLESIARQYAITLSITPPHATDELLTGSKSPLRTASLVLTGDSIQALTIIDALETFGRHVPNDCSLVSVHDELCPFVVPRLDTIDPRHDTLAQRVLANLTDVIDHGTTNNEAPVYAVLDEHGSIDAPRGLA